MSRIATAYAQGLYALAKDEGLEQEILGQLSVLEGCFAQDPEFIHLLAVPNLPVQERLGLLDDSFRGKVHPYILNYLKILTQKGYIRHFGDSVRAFETQYNEDHGILQVCAVSAVEMNENQRSALTRRLEEMTGKTIRLKNRVDPQVLGGVRLDYDGLRIDGTVKSRLDAVRKLLENTVI